ncbi:MAG: hypothetical protein EZS28_002616 [Streblomastix strix]|uniref:Protein kinase domain-containing protein n=1 Tax=Streblomastix strix TaxID=222440 RepID=A0A5J4X5F0_9EUKA|nr:MAG: hypothetical protein EZS28_002616 [Streblomastix strix]
MSMCFFRPNEIAEIRLKFSNVNKTENQASLRLAPKQANAIETYEVYETDNEKLSPKLAIYEQIDRLKKQFPKGTDFLLWHKGFNKPTTAKDISLQLTKLLRELKIIGASAYSIRHSATTELAKLEQTKQLGNQQMIHAKIMKGQTSPPKICILTRGEIEMKRKFPREMIDRTSGMMLIVGWNAWNDNAEIRIIPCLSVISLIQRIIDKEMLSTSCIDEYEEEIRRMSEIKPILKNDQTVNEESTHLILYFNSLTIILLIPLFPEATPQVGFLYVNRPYWSHNGEGAVYLAYDFEDDKIVAIKIFERIKYNKKELDANKELISAEKNNIFLLKIQHYSDDYQFPYLSMEYANMKSLDIIAKQSNIPLPSYILRALMKQILEGIRVFHNSGLIHRDIKCENILLHNPPGSGRIHVKLSDYGFAIKEDLSQQQKELKGFEDKYQL